MKDVLKKFRSPSSQAKQSFHYTSMSFCHGPPKAEEIARSFIRTPRYEPHGSYLAMILRGSFNSPMKQDSVSKETSLQDGEILYLI